VTDVLADDDRELTAEEILTFGPVVEAVVWTPMWLQESRAPVAVAAGRPKLGPVFNEEGIGKAVIIRPCVSRGKRIRGLPPIYTPSMLEKHADVWRGWPMFMDHAPAPVQEALVRRGRSVRELGGQVVRPWWQRDFTHEDDGLYGYQQGATLAEVWATPFMRSLVSNNPNLLHTSINAWPTSGKPGPVPWRPKVKGMTIEGIRSQPQGSVDFVVRGGAGGRLLAEAEEEGEWPQTGWTEESVALVVSAAESFYASRHAMPGTQSKPISEMDAAELREHIRTTAPHLVEALAPAAPPAPPAAAPPAPAAPPAAAAPALTEEDVRRLIEQSHAEESESLEERDERLQERVDQVIAEREGQRALSEAAFELIESAEGVPAGWKADLKARYAMLPSGPPPAIANLREGTAEDGSKLPLDKVLDKQVREDLARTRDLIAEAQGKPRVKGEGGKSKDPKDPKARVTESRREVPLWRQRLTEWGVVESEDKAIEVVGGKVEG
jgi:hypothetical protein